MQNIFSLFTVKRFLPLFITQFFGAFNDNAFKNAFLIWFTYDMAHKVSISASMMVTLAAGIFILPFFLFSAFSGELADKYEKAKLVRRIKLVEIILMLACYFGFLNQSIGFLLLVLFFMGAQSTFFGPIKYSLLPLQLAKEELVAGNALIEGGTFLAILLGTIFGGLIIRSNNGVEYMSLFVVLFAIIGFISSFYIPKTKVEAGNLKLKYNIFAETKKIMQFAATDKKVWLSIIGISWFWLIGATFLTQFPTYTKNFINGDEHVVTFFLTAFSVGIGIGSVLCHKLLKGKIKASIVPYGQIGIVLAIVLFSIFSYFLPAVDNNGLLNLTGFFNFGFVSVGITCSLVLLAVSAGIYVVPLYTVMQYYAKSSHLARTIAANNVMNALFMVASSIIILVLFAIKFDVVQILLTIGLCNILVYYFVIKKLQYGLNETISNG